MNNPGGQLRSDIDRNESRAHWAAWLIVVGLVIEAILAFIFPAGRSIIENWSPVITNALIALGVYGEILFSGRASRAQRALQSISDERVAEAEVRAAEANQIAEEEKLARVKLEAQLSPRSLTEQQFNVLQKLRGKISAVNIAAEVDLEPTWFATQILKAFHKAGIEMSFFGRGPTAHSSANILFDAHAFNNPNGEATNGEPLASVLKEAGMWDGALVAVMPMDIKGPVDIPMLIIGGRFPIHPASPYLGADNKSAMPP